VIIRASPCPSVLSSDPRPSESKALGVLPRLLLAAVAAFATASATATSPPYAPPFSTWTRLNGGDPILQPRGNGFEARGTFNPAVVRQGATFVMLYRAQDAQGVSTIGRATGTDGVRFTRENTPLLVAEASYEKGGGVEDPRLTEIGGIWYLTYTAYNGTDAQLALATSRDLRRFERRGVIMPANAGRWNVHWTKSGAILPDRVNGKYWMYYMADAAGAYDQTGIAWSTDLLSWTEALDRPVLPRRSGAFDSRVVEPGPPPVLTDAGILLIYNGADDTLVYRTGWALFDRQDPTRVIARSEAPIFSPEQAWERAGQVPNVVFVEGLVRDGARWLFYYGGADSAVGVAEATGGSTHPRHRIG
jgi:predicted GH43/DUF377 family glycosyl hydrolase